MVKNLNDYLVTLPKERQKVIEKRAADLITQEATLQKLRKARLQSQEAIAEKLQIKQAAVSKLELMKNTIKEFYHLENISYNPVL